MTIAPAAHDGGINGFGVWHRSRRWTGVGKLRGRAPTVDRGWSGLPHASAAPGDWIDRFFLSYDSVTPLWWGWIYHGGPNSAFVHACGLPNNPDCPGNSGDIRH